MEELKLLLKELEERKADLELRPKTEATISKISENLLMTLRVQQLLIPLVVEHLEKNSYIEVSTDPMANWKH